MTGSSAQRGEQAELFARLTTWSGLPGKVSNDRLLLDFATECAAIGKPVDALLLRMAGLTADEAPGATSLEFLPMCGVLGLGLRAATDASIRGTFLPILHDAADDLRWRVRATIPVALARIGSNVGESFALELDSWMNGYFHAAAVLLAVADPLWLPKFSDPAPIIAFHARAFELLAEAPRSRVRYPGHKALVEALSQVPASIAMRFGQPIFEMLAPHAGAKDPVIRDIITANAKSPRLRGRFRQDVDRLLSALEQSRPLPRDPTTNVGRTRQRGKRKQG